MLVDNRGATPDGGAAPLCNRPLAAVWALLQAEHQPVSVHQQERKDERGRAGEGEGEGKGQEGVEVNGEGPKTGWG